MGNDVPAIDKIKIDNFADIAFDLILKNLSEKDQEYFLFLLEKNPDSPQALDFAKAKIPNLEAKIREEYIKILKEKKGII
ncbi:hypothetical protein FJY90_03610 [Candidatus Gottesmanbacteria bacterium]|nr:hypothetical protein [Candidatus Gottesmanbacteria bacterium]